MNISFGICASADVPADTTLSSIPCRVRGRGKQGKITMERNAYRRQRYQPRLWIAAMAILGFVVIAVKLGV